MFKLLSTFIALKLFTIVIRLLVEVIRWFWFEACVTNTTIYRHHNASVTINMTLILVNYSPTELVFENLNVNLHSLSVVMLIPAWGLLMLDADADCCGSPWTSYQLQVCSDRWRGDRKTVLRPLLVSTSYRAQLTVAFTRTSVALNTCTAALARSCRYTGSWYYRGWRPRYLWPPSSVTTAPHSTSVSPL